MDRWAIRQSVSVNVGQMGIDDLHVLRAALSCYTGPTDETHKRAANLRRAFDFLIEVANAQYEEKTSA